MTMFLIFIFIIIRLIVISLAILFGYLLVKKIIDPYVLKPSCLTDTNSCAYMNVWKYENSFVAQVFPSGLYIWFNGSRLYVYGEAPGVCIDRDDFEPVDVINISGTNTDTVYIRQNYECVTKVSAVINYYTGVLKVDPVIIYIRGSSTVQTANLNVFDLFQTLIDEGIVSVDNIIKPKY